MKELMLLCRACRFRCEKTTDMSIVDPTDGKTLYDYFNDCTQLKATSEDGLPNILCVNCVQSLQQAYLFRQKAHRSDQELKMVLALRSKEEGQPEVLEDIEAATFIDDHRYFDMTQDSKGAALDPLSVSTNKEYSLAIKSSRRSREGNPVTSAVASASTISEDCLQSASAMRKSRRKSRIVKEKVQVELSYNKFEDSCEDELDDDKEENCSKYETKRKKHYNCDSCEYKCIQKNDLKKHVFELHKDTILCHKCSKVFELQVDMEMHKQLVHDTDINMCCPWCSNSELMKKGVLAKHLQKNHTSVYLKYFPRLRVLERGEDVPFQCERCQKAFSSIYELADHIQEHRFYCLVCPMSFRKVNTYKEHLKRKHNSSITILKSNLSSSGGLAESREFIRQKSVRLHEQKIHGKENPPRKECPICQKEVYEHYLQTHIARVHTSERKYSCDICGNSYKTCTLLSYHKKAHFDGKFVCNVCNRRFVRPNQLQVHMRVHTGEKPYGCHLCEQRFRNKALLNYHLQRHAGIKRRCNVCGKEYNRVDDLRTHSYKHTGMPYTCPTCDYGCTKRIKLRTHLQKKHNQVLTEDEISEIFKVNTGRYSRVKLAKDFGRLDNVMQ
ncbi:gastrula zinc finger protein XlCGF58.1-like isoform X2 [Eurosta solidaginis]|uniref:gastrula zinc finger protein XlCGF58.1-like isoform X2 n=1 Tax=Eurosta solidaginis TaxID=178769 RepID=UPI003530E30D